MYKSLNSCSAVFRDCNRLVSEHKACILMPFQAAFVSDCNASMLFKVLLHFSTYFAFVGSSLFLMFFVQTLG